MLASETTSSAKTIQPARRNREEGRATMVASGRPQIPRVSDVPETLLRIFVQAFPYEPLNFQGNGYYVWFCRQNRRDRV